MKSERILLTRRQALGAFGLLALASQVGFAADKAKSGKKTGIALQLYTVREAAKKDLTATLKQAADMGWKYVQWSGMPTLPADKIRAELDAAGLKAVACHPALEKFETSFEQEVAFWKTVGITDLAPGGMFKDCTKDLAGWKKGCKRLDVLGAKLRSVGLRLSFHNHQMEFEKFPGDARTKYDILIEETKPENMAFEIDVGWAHAAGVDVPQLMRRLKGRCPVIHAKDVIPNSDPKKHKLVPLGQGQVPWKDVFAAGREAGVEWYIYEQDRGDMPLWDFVKASYDWLSKQPV